MVLLEEYGPNIVHTNSIHNIVANAIPRLDFGPVQDEKANWMAFTKCWCSYIMYAPTEESTYPRQHQMNMPFTNCSKEDVIYTLMVKEIAQAQKDDAVLKNLSKKEVFHPPSRESPGPLQR